MTQGSFDDPRLTVVGLIVEVYGGLTTALDRVHAAHQLSGTDFGVLIRLARSPDRRLRMSDLAEQTGLSTSGITRIVDRLCDRELISRKNCDGDRRGCYASLTPAGSAHLTDTLPDLFIAIDQHVTYPLTTEQTDALVSALHVIRAQVRPGATAGADDSTTTNNTEPPTQ
ncbi:MAG: MarR family winged helix-turn-helix transcriptional regulator [Mycobacteriales bacterium]